MFCAVQCDQNREAAQAFQVTGIPQFNFFLKGEQTAVFKGADEPKFRQHLGELYKALGSKANEHMMLEFKQYKPMNKMPIAFESAGNIDKMKDFIRKFAQTSEKEVKSTTNIIAWLDNFDLKTAPQKAIDELVELAEVAEDKNKMALIDMFRLLIIHEAQAEYILSKHWELVSVCIIGYTGAQDMKAENKVMQNYHRICL